MTLGFFIVEPFALSAAYYAAGCVAVWASKAWVRAHG